MCLLTVPFMSGTYCSHHHFYLHHFQAVRDKPSSLLDSKSLELEFDMRKSTPDFNDQDTSPGRETLFYSLICPFDDAYLIENKTRRIRQ